MKTHKGRIPTRFKYQQTEKFHKTLEELESVIETLKKYEKDYIIVERKKGYAVFTTGNDIMTKDEEEKYRNQLWVHNKMKEGRL